MPKKPYKLDQVAQQIQGALTTEGAKITMLDYGDLHEGEETGEKIDLTIQRQGRMTLIELRSMGDEESWLTALGRKRRNLRADAAIAVYAAPPTDALIRMAENEGVLCRSAEVLTPDEMRDWGKPVAVRLIHAEFRQIKLLAGIEDADTHLLKDKPTLRSTRSDRSPISDIFAYLRDQFAGRLQVEWSGWQVHLGHRSLLVDEAPIKTLHVLFEARLVHEDILRAGVIAYDAPISEEGEQDGTTVIADMSGLKQENNRILYQVAFQWDRVKNLQRVRLIGADGLSDAPFRSIALDVYPTSQPPVSLEHVPS